MRSATTRKAEILAKSMQGLKPRQIAADLGVCLRTVYHHLDGQGVQPRKRRSDAGQRRQEIDPAAWSELLSLILRDDYAPEIAIEIMEANERLAQGEVKASWVNAQLRQLGITRRRAGRKGRTGPFTYVRRERNRPNVEHQCDATPAASIYIDTGEDVTYEPRSKLLKDRHLKGKTPVSIFGLVDAYSRAVYLRAYPTETWESWHDFLFRAWSRKERTEEFPFCGLPKILRPDKGSGLDNRSAHRAMAEIGVKVIAHEAGQPWKKGKIEAALKRYQRLCEPATHELKFTSFADLNLFLERAARWLNSRLHSETGAAPFSLWLSIADDELLYPPDWDAWQRLCYRQEEVRVREDLVITFGPHGDREEVELPYDPVVTAYVGKKITVLYAPGADDPVLLHLPPLPALNLSARELPVPRVRPGSRAPSQADSNRIIPGQLILREALDTDTSHLSRTAHMEAADRVWPAPIGGRQVELRSETMFQAAPVSRFKAVGLAQAEGVVATPPTEGDVAWLEELFAGREEIERAELDAAMAELGRVKQARQAFTQGA